MAAKSTSDVARVVLIGQLWVNLPVVIIIATISTMISHWIGPADERHMTLLVLMLHQIRFEIGVLAGAGLGWLWWSATITQWRSWSMRHCTERDQVQLWAERTLLVWPRGSNREKTGFGRD